MKLQEVDDTPYDASEEESVFERDKETQVIYLEKALPILDANIKIGSSAVPASRNRSERCGGRARASIVLAPSRWGIRHQTKEFGECGARQNIHKTRVVKRRASWPQPPPTPKAHDSGLQGLGDSDIDPTSGRGEVNQKGTKNRIKRKEKNEEVLLEIDVDGEEEQAVMFRGIADADSSEERWMQIVLEEHMDKIFNAVPKPPSEEQMGERVEDKEGRI